MRALFSGEKVKYSQDLFFLPSYGDLYLSPGDSVFKFKYTEGELMFTSTSIKRPIPSVFGPSSQVTYYDLETAYGFGGYVVNTQDPGFVERAINAYLLKCREENIVAEFIRFHPLDDFPLYHGKYFDFLRNDRNTVYIDLTLSLIHISEPTRP